jgi:tetratricopeptide (TPR) repeat protein
MKAYKEAPVGTFDESAYGLLAYNGGTVQTSMGMFDKATVSLDEALSVRRRLGDGDDIAATLNNMGMLYSSMHRFDVAERHWNEALQIHSTRADTQDRELSLMMVEHNLQRNAIQMGRADSFPSPEALQATVDFFECTVSWWMTAQYVLDPPIISWCRGLLMSLRSAYLVLGNLMFVLKKWGDAAKAYQKAVDTLRAPGRAGKQPAAAMMIYKLGCVEYELANFTLAA